MADMRQILKIKFWATILEYRTRAIITHGLYTFYPLFDVHLCTVNFGLMYGYYSRAVSNQERVIVGRVPYMDIQIRLDITKLQSVQSKIFGAYLVMNSWSV